MASLPTFRELLDYIGKLVDQRLAEPKDDLIGKLVVDQVRTLCPILFSL